LTELGCLRARRKLYQTRRRASGHSIKASDEHHTYIPQLGRRRRPQSLTCTSVLHAAGSGHMGPCAWQGMTTLPSSACDMHCLPQDPFLLRHSWFCGRCWGLPEAWRTSRTGVLPTRPITRVRRQPLVRLGP
jgi:hypothetical protein